LWRGQRIRAIVGVELDDPASLDVGNEQAASAAVVGRAANTDFLDRGRLTGPDSESLGSGIFYSLFFTRRKAHTFSVERMSLEG
jgi:hypothetical protein